MNEKINFDELMLNEAEKFCGGAKKPRLLLHACCAPCSSYCIEETVKYFDVTVFFYNPNIGDRDEYFKREEEEKRLVKSFSESGIKVGLLSGEYEPDCFYGAVKGHEKDREGGDRCRICFYLRLNKAAEYAKKHGYDYFTTTLTVSPLKNAAVINNIGTEIAAKHGIKFLPSDFKKRGGYIRSIELGKKYNLYRQNYCGCEFSKRELSEKHNLSD